MVITLFSANVKEVYADTAIFTDVKTTDWFYSNLVEAVEKGIINGYPDGTFRPNDKIKYQEFVKMLVLVTFTEEQIVTAVNNFEFGTWWERYYAAASRYFVFGSGYGWNNVLTDIKRSAMVGLIYNSLAYTRGNDGNKADKSGFNPLNKEELFYMSTLLKDVARAEEKDKILYVAKQGIIKGYTDKTFKPNEGLTRAEALTVTLRIIDETKRTPVAIDSSKIENIDKSELIHEPQFEFINNPKDYLFFSARITNWDNYSPNALYKIELDDAPELNIIQVKNAPAYPYVNMEYYNIWKQFSESHNAFNIPKEVNIAIDHIKAKEKWENLKSGHTLKICITVQEEIDGEIVEKVFIKDVTLTYEGSPTVTVVR